MFSGTVRDNIVYGNDDCREWPKFWRRRTFRACWCVSPPDWILRLRAAATATHAAKAAHPLPRYSRKPSRGGNNAATAVRLSVEAGAQKAEQE